MSQKQKETETYVKERLRGTRRVPVVAGEGQGGDCWRNGRELHQASANPKRWKYNGSTTCTTRHKMPWQKKKKGIGDVQLTVCPYPSHRARAGQQHRGSQSPGQQWQEVLPGTAREDSGETCNEHRPKPAPQSTRQLWPLRRCHSKNPLTAYDQAGPRSCARDNKPAACAPAATRHRNTTRGRRRHCQKLLL